MNWALVLGVLVMAGGADMPAAEQNPHYLACGCGCCGGMEPKKQCASAEEISEVAERDKAQKAAPQCAMAGCSAGTEYVLCDASQRPISVP